MQFEIGKSYHVDGDIIVCKNGLHFCERLIDVFDFYDKKEGNRFFEVEASGTVETDGHKNAASDLRIIRELTDIEINRTVYGNGNGNGYGNGNGNGNGNGYGYGNGNGNGYGDGNGYGNGNGNGYGNGYGDGYGDGYGNGYGNGNGYGYGYGYGDGDGDGYGDGYGNDIQRILIFV
jgi:hypothetical protein